jgi:hypothetical protein
MLQLTEMQHREAISSCGGHKDKRENYIIRSANICAQAYRVIQNNLTIYMEV